MKQLIKLRKGKTVELPVRIFREKERLDMQVDFVKDQIFVAIAQPKITNESGKIKKVDFDFGVVSSPVLKNMAVIKYPDCSGIPFSVEILKEAVKSQHDDEQCDFIVLPYFKDETEYDIRLKIELARRINEETSKDIILEISYKSTIPTKELTDAKEFDFLSIFYGVHYGRQPSFYRMIRRLLEFKRSDNRPVICNAVPIKFSGEEEDVVFLPFFYAIADAWCKNWKKAGGNKKIKVIDPKDFKVKDLVGWLASGYNLNDILPQVMRTVAELFLPTNLGVRTEFESIVVDTALNAVRSLTPITISSYTAEKAPASYVASVIFSYREKIIKRFFRESSIFNLYNERERRQIESNIRRIIDIGPIYNGLIKAAASNVKLPVSTLIRLLDEE